jgi:hypothetical protein
VEASSLNLVSRFLGDLKRFSHQKNNAGSCIGSAIAEKVKKCPEEVKVFFEKMRDDPEEAAADISEFLIPIVCSEAYLLSSPSALAWGGAFKGFDAIKAATGIERTSPFLNFANTTRKIIKEATECSKFIKEYGQKRFDILKRVGKKTKFNVSLKTVNKLKLDKKAFEDVQKVAAELKHFNKLSSQIKSKGKGIIDFFEGPCKKDLAKIENPHKRAAIKRASGHTIDEHINKTVQYLENRAMKYKHEIEAATSFYTKKGAEECAEKILNKNLEEIAWWLKNTLPSDKQLELCHVFKNPVGRGVWAGKKGITHESIHSVTAFIRKCEENELGFIIATMYPDAKKG